MARVYNHSFFGLGDPETSAKLLSTADPSLVSLVVESDNLMIHFGGTPKQVLDLADQIIQAALIYRTERDAPAGEIEIPR